MADDQVQGSAGNKWGLRQWQTEGHCRQHLQQSQVKFRQSPSLHEHCFTAVHAAQLSAVGQTRALNSDGGLSKASCWQCTAELLVRPGHRLDLSSRRAAGQIRRVRMHSRTLC